MYEGKIIKFYREKQKLTQEQLGQGICSGTHISKIERLQTEYAPEIITLLSERLGIDINLEVGKLLNLQKRLSYWHNVIIMQLFKEMDHINDELENEELIQISEYIYLYKLLRARYLLTYNKTDEAYKIIKEIEKIVPKLTPYERNLLKHVLGIYYMAKYDYLKAVGTLKEIQIDDYNNPEYYYHLSMAYHTLESPALAYFYAEKSHKFFKGINNYLRAIDAEMIMLIQIKDDNDPEIIMRFENLVQSCNLCNAPDRKAKVSHNLAYEQFRRGIYEDASRNYKESMFLKQKGTGPYLLSLEGYIKSSFYGNILPNTELLQLAEEGYEIARNNNLVLYIHLFKLLCFLIRDKVQEYHKYLLNQALPMFEKYGYSFLIRKSKQDLFTYYKNTNQVEKAFNMAEELINPVYN